MAQDGREKSMLLMFLTHFDDFCDQSLNRHTTTSNLIVLYDKENVKDTIYASVL